MSRLGSIWGQNRFKLSFQVGLGIGMRTFHGQGAVKVIDHVEVIALFEIDDSHLVESKT